MLKKHFSLLLISSVLNSLIFGILPAQGAGEGLRLTTTSVSLKVGQRVNLLASGGTGLTVTSNSAAVKAAMFGSYYIALTGVKNGSAKVTVCSQDAGCAVATVTVGAAASTDTVSPVPPPSKPASSTVPPASTPAAKVLPLSQSNVRVASQGTYTITAEGHDLTLTNSSAVVRTAVNDNQVTFYGVAVGKAVVKICDNKNYCATVNVVVTPGISAAFAVTPTSLTIETGKTAWLSTSNGTSVTVSSNSSVVSAKVKDALILLTAGSSVGKATVKVCSSKINCVLVYVTVKKGISIPSVSGSFNSVTIDIGQSVDIPFPKDDAITYYLTGSLLNPSVASLRVNASSFTVMGKSAGATLFRVCPLLPEYSCGTIGVTVRDSFYCGTAPKSLKLSDTSVTIVQMQTADITATSCKGLAAISDSVAVRTAVNGNRITLYAMQLGEAVVQVCDTTPTCVPVAVKVVARQ